MIQPRPTTIGEILMLSKQFSVPKYQRGYAWESDEATEFLDDLDSDAENGRGLFLGTFIFNISDESRDKITIVDGQQRLTTISLLLIACRELAKKLKANGIAQETQQRITATDPATAKSKGPLLVASESIRDVFASMTASDWNGVMQQKIGNKHVKRQVRRIKPVYDFFKERMKEYDQEQLSKMLSSIYKTRVIRIDIDEDEEAFNIFERTNARGMDLEVSDLLKNYLYQQKVPSLDDLWKQILENSEGTMLRMLKYFYVSQKGYVSKSELFPRLKRHCQDVGGAESFVEELRQFSTYYNIARGEDGPKAIKDYFDGKGCKAIASDPDKYQRVHIAFQALRLFKVSQTYPVIYSAITCLSGKNYAASAAAGKLFIRLLETMEKYHFINNIVCNRVGNEVEKLYAKFCVKFKDSKDFESTSNELMATLRKQLASEDEFTTRFCEISYTDSIPTVAYIFDRFNNYGLAPGERVTIYDPQKGHVRANHNVEHVSPQKPDGGPVPDSAMQQVLDNIGNLLILPFRANSSLGNQLPGKKVQRLRGDLQKKVQTLQCVKEFVEKYGDRAETWDEAAIAQRARDMAKQAYEQIWKV